METSKEIIAHIGDVIEVYQKRGDVNAADSLIHIHNCIRRALVDVLAEAEEAKAHPMLKLVGGRDFKVARVVVPPLVIPEVCTPVNEGGVS